MKRVIGCLSLILCLLAKFPATAQLADSKISGVDSELLPVTKILQPAGKTADFQVWQRIETFRDTKGNTLIRTNPAYLEMQTGMHYQEDGDWKESRELIEGYPSGAIARYGGHKVIFSESFASPVVVDLETPDGKRLQSRVLGLSYFDQASGKSVLFAESANASGKIVNSDQVIYADAFSGVKADARYTYTKAGLEQDVIFREQLPTPESFGLDSKTTRLQVITEFLSPPEPVIEPKTFGAEADRFEDQTLDFGVMQMGAGKAFMIGAGETDSLETPVTKRWSDVDGRTVLTEEVALSRIAKQLESLPTKKRTAFFWKKSGKAVATAKLNLPTRPARKPAKRAMQLAKLQSPDRGLVLDYVLVSSQANFTFKGDTTYYVSGVVNLSGTTTIEGGAVIKYNTGGTAISVSGSGLVCQTGPYRPAIFTSKHDDSVGEIIAGSNHSPSKPTTTLPIFLHTQVGNNPFKYLHFRYAGIALSQTYRPVWHCQFVECNIAISGDSQNSYGSTLELRNVLFTKCTTAVRNEPAYWAGSCLAVTGEHVTADQITQFMLNGCNYGGPASSLTNSILTAITSLGVPMTLDNCINPPDGTEIFESPNGGAGNYYLTDSARATLTSPNINPTLLSELRKKTTHCPKPSPASITSPTTWSPTVDRDTACTAPEIGYHYDALDYVVSELTLNAPLTLADGVAVGIRGASGFQAGTLVSIGSPSKHNTVALYSAVQEQRVASGANTSATYLLNGWNSDTRFWFTDILVAGSAGVCFTSAANNLELKDCFLHGAKLNIAGSYYATLGLTNNILERCDASLLSCYGGTYYANFYNNLLLNGNLAIGGACNGIIAQNAVVKNNLFVKGAFTYGTGGTPQISHNGYHNSIVTSQGTSPITITTANFQTGPLGGYYYPSTVAAGSLSGLINAGSMTAQAAGLGSHTTQIDQTPDSGMVDIGFHYHHIGLIKWTWSDSSIGTPISSSPAIGNNGIIFLTDAYHLYAINPATHALWTDWNSGPFSVHTQAELQASPMISVNGSTIYVGSFDPFSVPPGYVSFHAVNASNGSEKWNYSPNTYGSFSTGALDSNETIYVGRSGGINDNYFAVTDDPILGGINTPSFNGGLPKRLGNSSGIYYPEIDASAAIGIDGSTSFIVTEELGPPTIYAVNALGVTLWSQIVDNWGFGFAEFHASPSIGTDGTVYLGTSEGNLFAFHPDDQSPSSQIKWTYPTPLNDPITTTPVIGPDGTIYFGSFGNVLYAVKSDGTLKWKYEFRETCLDGIIGIFAALALAADGTLYVSSTDGNLYAMPTDSRAPFSGPLWQVQTPQQVGSKYELTSSPAIGADGMVYIGGSDGKLYAIQGVAGPALTGWPMWRKNNAHQANAVMPLP